MSKIIYDVYQNKNENNVSYGKYFGRIVHTETLNTRKLAKHIAEHGSVYTEDVVSGVLTKAEACIVEMLLESKKVKLEGLGTFYLMAENKKGGAVSIDKFNPKTSFKGLHIRFLPEQTTEENISSREFLKQAEFINIDSLLPKEDEENGGSTPGGGSSDIPGSGGVTPGEAGNGDDEGE